MIGTVLSDRYRLQSKLGSGGMSTVYMATDETLERPVAVKILHREMSGEGDQLERFRREARSAARIQHPNIVGVIDAGEDGGTPYIVFECVEGQTLKMLIAERGPLAVDEAIAYAIEVGRGLAAAHARLLVHRDVKPQNVLIDHEGRAKVTDFGIARSLEAEGLTATGRVIGTTDYVSPEQAMGKDVDERSDVYALGIVLYEMLAGEVPFHAETQVGVAMKHVNEEIPDIRERRPDVSANLAAVLDRTTAKDPDQRYGSIDELLADLESSLDLEAARSGGTTGEATAVLESVPPPRRRLTGQRRVSGLGVLMGLVGVGLIAAALLVGEGTRLGGSSEASEINLARGSAQAFDPPPGDGAEHDDKVDLAIDGNATGTAWRTETYMHEDFGNKEGVGLILDAGEPVRVGAVELTSRTGGWDVEIRNAPGETDPPDSIEGWRQVGGAEDVSESERITIQTGERAQYFLVWITKLAPTEDGRAGYRVELSDVKLLGS